MVYFICFIISILNIPNQAHMYANSYFESGSNLMVSKWRIGGRVKVVFQQGAHDAVGGAGERLDEARLHVVDISNCLPSGRLVGVHGDC